MKFLAKLLLFASLAVVAISVLLISTSGPSHPTVGSGLDVLVYMFIGGGIALALGTASFVFFGISKMFNKKKA